MYVFLEAGRGRCPELLPYRDQTDGGEIHRDPGVYREGTGPLLIVSSAMRSHYYYYIAFDEFHGVRILILT